MAKQRVVDTHFWDDSFVLDLDPIEKLLFLYLLTNPLTDICGAYEIRVKRIAADTGIDQEMVTKILQRFEDAGKVIYREGWILIVNFIRNQKKNPSVVQGVIRSLNDCPDWVRGFFLQTGDRLGTDWGQSVLPNLTKPNLTKHNLTEKPKEASASFVTDFFDLMKNYLAVVQLPNEPDWLRVADFAAVNGYTPEQVLDCYKFLESQPWRTGAISPKAMETNLPKFVRETMNPQAKFDIDLSSLQTQ